MKNKVIICFISLLTILFLFGCNNTLTNEKVDLNNVADFILNISEDREFRILQLTDIQIIDADQRRTENRISDGSKTAWKIENINSLAFAYMDDCVNKANPDLIVLSGDNVYGEFDDLGTSLDLLIEHMDSYKIPWTLVYGNHDNETILGARAQNEKFINSEYCMFARGNDEAEGNGNFSIAITINDNLREVIYLVDTHGCVNADKEEQVYSAPDVFNGQFKWLKQSFNDYKEYNNGTNPKSLVFEHFPLRAMGDGLQKYGYTSIKNDFYASDGSSSKFNPVVIPNNDNGDYGEINEDPNFIDSNYSYFNLLKDNNCEGVFFGHNHTNACSVTYEGVRLTFGNKSSLYDSYKKSLIGGTLILLNKDDSLSVSPIYSGGLDE